MGYMKEKVAYLKGLAEGMNIGGEGQGKLLNAMISTMDEMADAIDENEAAMAEIDECLDDIYDELDNIDDYLSDDEDEDEDEEDDDEAATVWSASARSIEGLRALVTPRCAFQSPVSRRYYVKHGRYCHKPRGMLRPTYLCWSIR